MRFGYQGITEEGVPLEGVVIAASGSSASAVFDAYAPHGELPTVIEALRLMWNGGFRHVPVVADDKLVGVVSRADFKGLEQGRLEEERDLWECL